ncbi:6-phospho-3-hexuloisomerase [Fructobacillus ficulneus]|uniref:3-hexulose-6-phosphate isomerase n=1 Tax=Fructobacillus ficulneus TaxID=157463 RepID=A0A0K8MG69_9LACO|nr:6-phospho-3-hexuloisomerase [Fructobacillus ficulneus]GAO99541.1 3-hexulose-6-phosphate isomerase [Fructobacillus ficulneus]
MNWAELLTELQQNLDSEFSPAALAQIKAAPQIFLTGAGRSGLALKSFAMRLTQLGKSAHVVGETNTPAMNAGDLLIVASSSGETPQLIHLATIAKEVGGQVWLWSTNTQSSLAQEADIVTVLAGKNKFAGTTQVTQQPLGTLFEQSVWLFGDLFVTHYMDAYQISEAEMQKRHTNLE